MQKDAVIQWLRFYASPARLLRNSSVMGKWSLTTAMRPCRVCSLQNVRQLIQAVEVTLVKEAPVSSMFTHISLPMRIDLLSFPKHVKC